MSSTVDVDANAQRLYNDANTMFNADKDRVRSSFDAWKAKMSAVGCSQTDQPTQVALQAVESALNTWRSHINEQMERAGNKMDHHVDTIGVLATQVADDKVILQKLRSEAGTRVDQANTVNPKIVGTPSSNILWLNRNFRASTRATLLVSSIVLGILAAVGLAYFIYASEIIQNTAGVIASTTGSAVDSLRMKIIGGVVLAGLTTVIIGFFRSYIINIATRGSVNYAVK